MRTPLYRQVRDRLVAGIADGRWRPGRMLPSEMALAARLRVSQGTVRKALDLMAAENLIVRRQGKGTFVAAHSAERTLFHFFHMVGDDGGRRLPATSRVLHCRRRRASREESDRLSLPPGERIIEIRRVRDMAGRPAMVETIVVPAALFPDLDRSALNDLPNELYHLYETGYGVTIHRARELLRAVSAPDREAALLNLKPGAPLLEIERLATTIDGRPVEYRISRCDTRRHRYESEIV